MNVGGLKTQIPNNNFSQYHSINACKMKREGNKMCALFVSNVDDNKDGVTVKVNHLLAHFSRAKYELAGCLPFTYEKTFLPWCTQ